MTSNDANRRGRDGPTSEGAAEASADAPLPAASSGESLRAYVARVAPALRRRLAAVRLRGRQAEWARITADVAAGFGEEVAQRTLETYLAAHRGAEPASREEAVRPPSAPPVRAAHHLTATRGQRRTSKAEYATGAMGIGRYSVPRD